MQITPFPHNSDLQKILTPHSQMTLTSTREDYAGIPKPGPRGPVRFRRNVAGGGPRLRDALAAHGEVDLSPHCRTGDPGRLRAELPPGGGADRRLPPSPPGTLLPPRRSGPCAQARHPLQPRRSRPPGRGTPGGPGLPRPRKPHLRGAPAAGERSLARTSLGARPSSPARQ